MSNRNQDLWQVRPRSDGLALELWGGVNPAVVLTQGERQVRVNPARAKDLVAALAEAAADLAELQAKDAKQTLR